MGTGELLGKPVEHRPGRPHSRSDTTSTAAYGTAIRSIGAAALRLESRSTG